MVFVWLHGACVCSSEASFFVQLMAELQRLVADSHLKVTSRRSWKEITPKVLHQTKIEAAHNSRLRAAIAETSLDDDDDGMLRNAAVLLCVVYLCYSQFL